MLGDLLRWAVGAWWHLFPCFAWVNFLVSTIFVGKPPALVEKVAGIQEVGKMVIRLGLSPTRKQTFEGALLFGKPLYACVSAFSESRTRKL